MLVIETSIMNNKLHVIQTFYVPGTLYICNYLTLITIQHEGPYNYHDFTDKEELKAQRD